MSSLSSRISGALSGHYRLEDEIGAGGGSAGNFGHVPAFEAALHLEQVGRAGTSEGVPEASATVHRTMGRVGAAA
jgi:hypothetical protein